jgi:hypothetical protein
MEEGLGRSIQKEIKNGSLKGITLHPRMDPLSYLQFLDANILMGTPTIKKVK